MRLINVRTLELETVVDERQLPPYAILSHRWMDSEVEFPELTGLQDPVNILEQTHEDNSDMSQSWRKICGTCKLAASQGLSYAWIDTCCIDKSSSAELSEAINSMFRWYQNATVCLVYLQDVQAGLRSGGDDANLVQAFGASAWFDRGWTLQELLAPRYLRFYDKAWAPLGDLHRANSEQSSACHESKDQQQSLVELISRRSGIGTNVLLGTKPLSSISVGARMSWASQRRTTRVEDEAYCLLGLFGVNMPLLYGEGRQAFTRLQQEILRESNDQTIFAWSGPESQILAPSPAGFARCGSLIALRSSLDEDPLELTKQGLRIAVQMTYFTIQPPGILDEVRLEFREWREDSSRVCRHICNHSRSVANQIRIDSASGADLTTELCEMGQYPNLLQGQHALLERVNGAWANGELPIISDSDDTTHDGYLLRQLYTKAEKLHEITVGKDKRPVTLFAILGCYDADKPNLFPALKVMASGSKFHQFTLQNHSLVFLSGSTFGDRFGSFVLEGVTKADSQRAAQFERGWARSHRHSKMRDPRPWYQRVSWSRQGYGERFPVNRSINAVDILAGSSPAGPEADMTIPIRLVLLENALRFKLERCWPENSWDLGTQSTLMCTGNSLRPEFRRSVLRLLDERGHGVYLLFGLSTDNTAFLYMARVRPGLSVSPKILGFLHETADRKYYDRHSTIPWSLWSNVAAEIKDVCIGHHTKGKEIRVTFQRRSPSLQVGVRYLTLLVSASISSTIALILRYSRLRSPWRLMSLLICQAIFGAVTLFFLYQFIKGEWSRVKRELDRRRYRR